MSINLENALNLLEKNNDAIVVINNDRIFESKNQGVSTLIDLLENNKELLYGASVCDKVVGKAAAFLFCLGKIKELHAKIISEPAIEVVEKNGISLTFDKKVKNIQNRDKTDLCPMEKCTLDIDNGIDALNSIKQKIQALRNSNKWIILN